MPCDQMDSVIADTADIVWSSLEWTHDNWNRSSALLGHSNIVHVDDGGIEDKTSEQDKDGFCSPNSWDIVRKVPWISWQ